METRISFLSEQAIEEYREIFRKNYGVLLTLEDATDNAESFIGFYNQVVYGEKLENKEDKPMDRN